MLKKDHAFIPSAPLVNTNGVNGNGGGMIARAATTVAPRLTRTFTCARRFGFTNLVSPASPAFRPIQNVSAAPTLDPIVASSGYSQNRSGFRAAMMMTTKSMPSGKKKIMDASSTPINTTPPGVRKYPRTEKKNLRTPHPQQIGSRPGDLSHSVVTI